MKKLLLIAAMLLMCCITRAQAQAGSTTADAAVWGYSGKDLSAVIYLPEMPANEQIELTVTYSDESAETRELFYGKKGIIHRFMELTPEVKLEYARKVDICLQLPMPFLTFSQCGSFITEDPYGAVRYIEALDTDALKAELDSRRNSAKSSSTRSLNRQNCNSLRPGFPTYME